MAGYFRDEAGKVFEVPADQVDVAVRAGLVPASDKDVDAALKREQAASTSGQVKAFSEGFASGTVDAATAIPRTLSALGAHVAGVDDPLADMTGRGALETTAYAAGGGGLEGARKAQEYAEGARLRAEENAVSSTAGTIGGQILGAELGGLGALARGAGGAVSRGLGGTAKTVLTGPGGRALTAAERFALAGSEAESAALATAGKAGMNTALPGLAARGARIAGSGIAGGLEGAPLNLVAAQDQAYIENRKLTGEMALGAMGMGALIGGGLGAGVRGIGEAIGAGKQAIANRFAKPATGEDAVRVAEQQFGEAAPGLHDAYANLSGAVSGKDPEAIKALTGGFLKRGEGAEARRIAVYEGDAIREAAKREVVQHVDDMANATRNLTEEWQGALKEKNVAKVISKGESSAAQVAQADAQLGAIKSKLQEMLDDPAAYGERAKLQKLSRHIETTERALGNAVETGSNEGMFVALDTLKKKMAPLASPGRMITASSDAAVAQEMRGLYEGLRTSLQDEAVWGGAASMQREVNEPFTRWLKSKNIFDRRFMTETGDLAANPWERTMGADPKAAHAYVEGLTSAKNDLDHQLIRKHIQNTKDLAASLSKAGELTPEKAAELSRVVKAAEGFEQTVQKAEKSLVLSNQLRALEKMESGGLGELGGAAVGGMVGGPIGAAIGAVGGALKNPGLMVRRMAMMERLAEKANVSIDGSLGKLFAGIEGAGSKLKTAAAATKNAVTPTALELFQGKYKTPELAYQARAREILDADANYGQRIRDNAAQVFGNSFDADPHAVGAAVVATTKAVRLLAEKMPAGLVQSQSLTPMSTKTAPSRMAIQEFAMIHTAVTQPLAVIADIPKGTVTRDQIDAIAEVHPALIQHVRMNVLERLQKLDQKGIEVPLRQRIILDSLLDLDGAGEPVLSSEFGEKYSQQMSDTAAALSEATAPKPRPGPSKIGERLKTPTDSMIGGV